MYVGLKQPRGDGERCVTPARAAAKETNLSAVCSSYMTKFVSPDPRCSKTFFRQFLILSWIVWIAEEQSSTIHDLILVNDGFHR